MEGSRSEGYNKNNDEQPQDLSANLEFSKKITGDDQSPEIPSPETVIQEFDLGKEFIESGGTVLAYYLDGRPCRWKCGRGKNGEIIDPKGMSKEAIPYLNEHGEWEAGNPSPELLEEIRMWRSDWLD